MRKKLSVLLVIVMIVCFAGALSYPLMYRQQERSNEADMDTLREMRMAALENSAAPAQQTDGSAQSAAMEQPSTAPQSMLLQAENTASPMSGPVDSGAAIGDSADDEVAYIGQADIESADTDAVSSQAGQTPPSDSGLREAAAQEDEVEEYVPETVQERDRRERTGEKLAYDNKEKVQFSENMILPQYREIYAQNNDCVGWICMPRIGIDYPVLQNEDNDYYLKRDFFGNDNKNGQLILDAKCDPWTPSYNLVISGHNMKNRTMFGALPYFESKGYWRLNKLFTFDTMISEGTYVVFAAFYSADYDEDEEGFRYNADIRYRLDFEIWMAEIEENKLYDTGIDVQFGDEFLTLTTCTYQREGGRFVVVARKVRDGEVIE